MGNHLSRHRPPRVLEPRITPQHTGGIVQTDECVQSFFFLGVKDSLRTRCTSPGRPSGPGALVVCGVGYWSYGGASREVWRLDLGELCWQRMPDMLLKRNHHACCVVRGALIVLGGLVETTTGAFKTTASVEILRRNGPDDVEGKFHELPGLSSGPLYGCIALPIIESQSDLGQVLLLGGYDVDGRSSSSVYKVDLATGACSRQPSSPSPSEIQSAARLPDGRIICIRGGDFLIATAHVLEPPEESPIEGSWQWRDLPSGKDVTGGAVCVLSDGRFSQGLEACVRGCARRRPLMVMVGGGTRYRQCSYS